MSSFSFSGNLWFVPDVLDEKKRKSALKSISGVLSALAVLACACSLPLAIRSGRSAVFTVHAAEMSEEIRYTADGSLLMPRDYREWIFLSAGMDMSYNPKAVSTEHHTFNNVFVSPSAYRSFKETGTWPDKTVLVLEIRGAENQPTLNQHGQTQGRNVTGIEVHLKDTTRYRDGWAFFDVGDDGRGHYIQPKADCYSCHQNHAAVDTTFAQFYPTLMPVAEAHKTLSPAYLKELASAR